ncbi:MAG TPA: hypothetical protein PLC74_00975 [Acetobacteraceae bacterium]|nr:hypothetical protein [Acetobacteraceae bacterium]
MDKNSKREPSLKEPQIDRFKEAARQMEADEDEAAFDEKLKGLAGHKPKGQNKEVKDE